LLTSPHLLHQEQKISEPGYESNAAVDFVPIVPSLSFFFTAAKVSTEEGEEDEESDAANVKSDSKTASTF
jgi:hypothetical protein